MESSKIFSGKWSFASDGKYLHNMDSISVLKFGGRVIAPYYFRVNAFSWWDVLVMQMKQKGCNSIFIFSVFNQNRLKIS